MALINYNEYFDFDGYKAAIKDLTTANKEFGKSVLDLNGQIKVSYKGVREELLGYADTLSQFNVNTKGAATQLASLGVEVDKQTKRYQDQRQTVQTLLDVQDLNTRSINELKAAAKQLETEYNSLGGSSADLQAKKLALATEFQRVTQAAKMQAAALKASTPEIKFAADSYKGLQMELTEVGNKLKNLSGAFDPLSGKLNENNKEAVALQKRYIELNGTLKNIDGGLGNFQRNVGNYKSGFSGLNTSINQITREFPAFSNSVQTGFLAISNNLPIFFDEISKTNKEIKALRAQGEQVPGLFSALTKSVFSFGTVLSLGVTLLTLYGKDIVDFAEKIIKGAKSIDTAAENIKNLNDVFKEGNKDAGKQIATLDALYKAATNAALGDDIRRKAAKELQKEFPQTFENITVENILLGKAAEAYNSLTEAIIKTSRAKAAQSKIDEIQAKILDIDIQKQKITNASLNQSARAKTPKRVSSEGPVTFGGDRTELISVEEQKRRIKRNESIALKAQDEAAKSLIAQRDFLIKFVGEDNIVNAIIGKPEKPNTREADRALRLYEKELKRRQDLLKANFDEEVAAAQKQLNERIIDQTGFEKTKFNAAVKFTRAAIAEEQAVNKVGYKASEAKIKEFNVFREQANNAYIKSVVDGTDEARKESLELLKKSIEEEAQIEIAGLKDYQQYELSNQRLTNEQRVKLEIQYQNRLDQILVDSLEARAALEIDTIKKNDLLKQAKLLRTGISNRSDFGSAVSIPRAAGADQVRVLEDEQNRLRTLGILTVQQELDTAIKIRDIRKKLNEDTRSDDQKIIELKKKQQDEIVNYVRSSAQAAGVVLGNGLTEVFDSITASFQKLANDGELTFNDLANAGIASANAITLSYKSNIDDQLKALERQKNEELKLAGNNASAQAAINARFAREQAQLENKKAKADRENAIFQIAINTAQAVAKSIAESPLTFGLPFSAFALAAGALQTALVLSKPLPKFEKGTRNAPEGFAIVDEKGPELIIDKHGRLREIGGHDGPRTTYLQKGDQVKTAGETKRLLAQMETDKVIREIQLNSKLSGSLQAGKQAEQVKIMARAMQGSGISESVLIGAFQQAVKQIPKTDFIFNEKGFVKRVKEAGRTTTYLNGFNIGR